MPANFGKKLNTFPKPTPRTVPSQSVSGGGTSGDLGKDYFGVYPILKTSPMPPLPNIPNYADDGLACPLPQDSYPGLYIQLPGSFTSPVKIFTSPTSSIGYSPSAGYEWLGFMVADGAFFGFELEDLGGASGEVKQIRLDNTGSQPEFILEQFQIVDDVANIRWNYPQNINDAANILPGGTLFRGLLVSTFDADISSRINNMNSVTGIIEGPQYAFQAVSDTQYINMFDSEFFYHERQSRTATTVKDHGAPIIMPPECGIGSGDQNTKLIHWDDYILQVACNQDGEASVSADRRFWLKSDIERFIQRLEYPNA